MQVSWSTSTTFPLTIFSILIRVSFDNICCKNNFNYQLCNIALAIWGAVCVGIIDSQTIEEDNQLANLSRADEFLELAAYPM